MASLEGETSNRLFETLEEAFSAAEEKLTIIGSVGRFEKIKDPMNLARAFVDLLQSSPELRQSTRLMMVGDGSERTRVQAFLDDAGVAENCWLPGARKDVAALLGCIDVFVLPSRGEGISNTMLEAMASGLTVVATQVGGNRELIADGETGSLVPHSDPHALANAIGAYVRSSDIRRNCRLQAAKTAGRSQAAIIRHGISWSMSTKRLTVRPVLSVHHFDRAISSGSTRLETRVS